MFNNYMECVNSLKEVLNCKDRIESIKNDVNSEDFECYRMREKYEEVMLIGYKISSVDNFKFNMYLDKVSNTISALSKDLLKEVVVCIGSLVERAENDLQFEIVKAYLNDNANYQSSNGRIAA